MTYFAQNKVYLKAQHTRKATVFLDSATMAEKRWLLLLFVAVLIWENAATVMAQPVNAGDSPRQQPNDKLSLIFESASDVNPLSYSVFTKRSGSPVEVGAVECSSFQSLREKDYSGSSGPMNLPSSLSFLPATLRFFSIGSDQRRKLVGELDLPAPYTYGNPELRIVWKDPSPQKNSVDGLSLMPAYRFSLDQTSSEVDVDVTSLLYGTSAEYGLPEDPNEVKSFYKPPLTDLKLTTGQERGTAVLRIDGRSVAQLYTEIDESMLSNNNLRMLTPGKIGESRRVYYDSEDEDDDTSNPATGDEGVENSDDEDDDDFGVQQPEGSRSSVSSLTDKFRNQLNLNLHHLSELSSNNSFSTPRIESNIVEHEHLSFYGDRSFGLAFFMSLVPVKNYFALLAKYYNSAPSPQYAPTPENSGLYVHPDYNSDDDALYDDDLDYDYDEEEDDDANFYIEG